MLVISMKKGILTFLLSISFYAFLTAQSIENKWILDGIKDVSGIPLEVKKGDYFVFNEEQFSYSINQETSKGDYLHQKKVVLLFPDSVEDSIIKYKIKSHTDTTLVLFKKGVSYSFISPKENISIAKISDKILVPNQGFSFNSLWRGILGMIVLLVIAYLFSNNRKAINWKTVGVGLGAQLLLAVGVLKINFVQAAFDFVGQRFVDILDFTRAGSEFLLGGLMDVNSYGFIFLFQVLPTIIFFSALTSVLFYLGVIQIVVKGMAWVLTKLMGISGAESLSVAGNIFLGQTEAPLMIKAYLERMTRSEILLVMVGGMATVAGGVLAAYIGFLGGDDPVLRLEFAKQIIHHMINSP